MTGAAGYYASIKDDERSLAEFKLHTRDASHEVRGRIDAYFAVLRSAGSFFAGSNSVTRTEWNQYVDFLKPKENYPGIDGLGVIRYIPDSQKKIFENTVRHENSQSLADYTIHPAGVRDAYYPVEYYWPSLPNFNLLGLDHGAYPVGLKALQIARDSAEITISKDLPYAQGSDRKPPILFLFPIYRKGLSTATVDERQRAIWGFIYARVNTDKLFHGVPGPSVIQEIYFKVYDAGFSDQEISSRDKARLIYDSDPANIPDAPPFKSRHQVTEKVAVDGSTWLFYSASRPGGVIDGHDGMPLFILLGGSLLSISASCFAFTRNRQRQLIHQQAYYDHLTGLPNRMLFQDRFRQALANAQRQGTEMALLFLDLDNFKPINDSLGHDIGDKVLKVVTARLTSCLREGDTLARIGGDEFVILLLNIDGKEDASSVAQKVIDIISEPILMKARDMQIGCSIGISIFPKDGADYDALLKNADTAMYRAKEKGRNNFQFHAG
ncbi:MAG: diguanylate cyclase [Gallionella sp.]|nr:diguanylate cyclase [Gallionella sp.]